MTEAYEILRVEESVDFDALGKPVYQMRVTFKVNAHGPFYRTFPKDGFSAAAVKVALDAFARELHELQS